MLIMKRRIGETIDVDPGVTVTVLGTDEDQVILRFRRVTDADTDQDSVGPAQLLGSTAASSN